MVIFESLRIVALPLYSLISRFRKGEGALLFLTLYLSWLNYRSVGMLLQHGVAGFLALSLMYALNDIHDAPLDVRDPRRANPWVSLLVRRQTEAYLVHACEVLLLLAWLYLFSGVNAPLIITFGVSAFYSLWAKGRPGFDIAAVFMWGPGFIYSFVPAAATLLLVNAGFMLAMSHTFQMYRDLLVDSANGITTTAVYGRKLSAGIFVFCAFASVSCFFMLGELIPASLALVAAILPLFIRFSMRSWLLAKVFQAFAWLALMIRYDP